MKRTNYTLFVLFCCMSTTHSTDVDVPLLPEAVKGGYPTEIIRKAFDREESPTELGFALVIAADRGNVGAVLIILKKGYLIEQRLIDAAIVSAQSRGYPNIVFLLKNN